MNTSSKRLQKLPEIPQDIVTDILFRLPVKSLLRFKLVSKTWYKLIKSPRFVSMHHNSGTESLLLLCSNVHHEIERYDHVFSLRSIEKHARVLSPDLEIPETHSTLYVAGSCNGIVCYVDYFGQVFLSNPATREFKKLPPTSIKSDLTSWQVGVCFGFDSSNIYEFKVVRVLGVHNKRISKYFHMTWRTEIFTLSSNTWRHIEWSFDKNLLLLECKGLFWANSFHFLGKSRGSSKLTIACLDFHTEKVTIMDFPLKADHLVNCDSKSLMVIKEFLSVLFTRRCEYGSVEIWIMKDYGVVESWTEVCRIRTPLGIARALCFVWMEEHALLLVQDKRDNLVTCDLDSLHLEGLKIDGYNWNSEVVVHKESLVSIMRHSLPFQENLL